MNKLYVFFYQILHVLFVFRITTTFCQENLDRSLFKGLLPILLEIVIYISVLNTVISELARLTI